MAHLISITVNGSVWDQLQRGRINRRNVLLAGGCLLLLLGFGNVSSMFGSLLLSHVFFQFFVVGPTEIESWIEKLGL